LGVTLTVMEVHLPEAHQAQLNELAARTGRGADDLVREAVARMLADAAAFREKVRAGLDEVERGEFLEEEEMDRRVQHMLRR